MAVGSVTAVVGMALFFVARALLPAKPRPNGVGKDLGQVRVTRALTLTPLPLGPAPRPSEAAGATSARVPQPFGVVPLLGATW